MNTGTWVDTGTEWVRLSDGATDPGAEPVAGFGTSPFGTSAFGGTQ